MEDKIIEGLAYALPALVTGGVAFYMMNSFLKQNNSAKKFDMLAQKKKESLPIRLQAYERMILFCERINPIKMLIRVKPVGSDVEGYLQLVIQQIEQEFDHNLVQQLYVSDECWNVIIASKNSLLNKLKQIAAKSNSASDFRENVLLDYTKEQPPTDVAVAFLKQEVKKIL